MRKTTKVVALDIHKESTTVAVAGSDRKELRLYGDIPSTGEAISSWWTSSVDRQFCCGFTMKPIRAATVYTVG